ncbi:MAG: acetate/propionate family kinase [Brevundimonas sp.]|uniref:acetate/propionate family kinase n=1 Tax=Brevundimonas sp. TaxID=1871086 RepID=UPI0027283DAF|nr:acetate/propionate family kinase [Brevundimonas sp.]MDO9588150.1 acetate/propionate family kinase [Brevundimonas sp.]MDP3655887.1 acetate/propionate family kinase [Brevundimonas sp.]MDZ4108893.1 acetate/propionate family kinase [Brevundimonas sp.]
MSAPRLLTLNAGSSSLKFAVYDATPGLRLRLSGQVSELGAAPRLRVRAGEDVLADEPWAETRGLDAVLERTLDWVADADGSEGLRAVGHRIVHGGLEFRAPAELTATVMERLERLAPLAPLHQPFNLRGVAMAAERFPDALQVGVFDTAFHASQPDVARLYALPRELISEGVLAYGFHGLSYDYIASVLRAREGPRAGGRTIVMHLGSGVSLCALAEGRSIATTMGFSALDGPPMSTRSGALDPGVVLHLLQDKGMSVEQVTDLLYNHSGLLGLSGLSGDMVTLLASAQPDARQALEVYVYRIAREIGSLAASLGGLDTLVFTAGVGENAAPIRARIVDLCGWLGVRLDVEANARDAMEISGPDSAVKVLIIPTDEQVIIAQGAAALLGRQRDGARPESAGAPPSPFG